MESKYDGECLLNDISQARVKYQCRYKHNQEEGHFGNCMQGGGI